MKKANFLILLDWHILKTPTSKRQNLLSWDILRQEWGSRTKIIRQEVAEAKSQVDSLNLVQIITEYQVTQLLK